VGNWTVSDMTGVRLQLVQRRVDILNNILVNVSGIVDKLVCVWYTRCRRRNEMVHFLCTTL